jgi:hypothetical protein
MIADTDVANKILVWLDRQSAVGHHGETPREVPSIQRAFSRRHPFLDEVVELSGRRKRCSEIASARVRSRGLTVPADMHDKRIVPISIKHLISKAIESGRCDAVIF